MGILASSFVTRGISATIRCCGDGAVVPPHLGLALGGEVDGSFLATTEGEITEF